MEVDDVYLLGAGASFVHGSPLTDQLLWYALAVSPNRRDPRLTLVRDFLAQVFDFRPPRTAAAPVWSEMPRLVDLLSMIDMALDRRESLAQRFDVVRLRQVRTAVEFAIFDALEVSLRQRVRGQPWRRSRATHRLAGLLDPRRAAVISLNYDVIADIALAMRGRRDFPFDRADLEMLSAGDHAAIDYGVEFSNVATVATQRLRFRLLKLHGSFNWLRSRLTGNLYFGGMQKAVGILFRTPAQQAAASLDTYFRVKSGHGPIPEPIDELEPVLITPTHLKDLRNPHLAAIWRRAEECLRAARRITFIGYSLPGEDLHVKYLLKRAIATRPRGLRPPAIVVVDKGRAATSAVRANYERFFGRSQVRYHGEGFEAWLERHAAGGLQ
jgi:hypothetical protein